MVNIYQVSDTRWSNALTTYNAIWMDVNNGAGGAAVGASASRLLKLTNNTTEVFGVNLNGSMQITSPSLTVSDPHNINQTWNNAGVTFTAWKLSVTDTSSSASSLLVDMQVGGTSQLNLTKAGLLTVNGSVAALGSGFNANSTTAFILSAQGTIVISRPASGSTIAICNNAYWQRIDLYANNTIVASAMTTGFSIGSGGDVLLARDAADNLALRRTTNAQNFRVYTTYTDSSNGAWAFINAAQTGGTEGGAANTLTFGTIGNGTGAANLTKFKLLVDGTSRLDYNVTSASRWTTGSSFRTQGSLYADSYLILHVSQHVWLSASASGVLLLFDAAGTDFNRIQLGGTTSSFPAIKRSSAILQARLADDSGYTDINVRGIVANAYTVASLPTAASAGAGAQFYVTDSSQNTYLATVSGGGANALMIFSDGTQYKVG